MKSVLIASALMLALASPSFGEETQQPPKPGEMMSPAMEKVQKAWNAAEVVRETLISAVNELGHETMNLRAQLNAAQDQIKDLQKQLEGAGKN